MEMKNNDKEALQYLVDLGKRLNDGTIIEVDGEKYTTAQTFERIYPVDPMRPEYREIYSLTGFKDYILSDIDKHLAHHKRLIVRIASPSIVSLESPIYGVEAKSDTLAICKANIPQISFDRYMASEDFQIMLMTRFVETENRNNVLAFTGKIVTDEGLEMADDGFSQRVVVRSSVASQANVVIENPVYLAPIRTFHEIEQPESPFILRFNKDNGNPALFEADGGAWKNVAVKYIAAWLADKLPQDGSIQIIA